MSVTAFPVLSRILTEGKLLHTRVGISTISSAGMTAQFTGSVYRLSLQGQLAVQLHFLMFTTSAVVSVLSHSGVNSAADSV
jgi:hypothetical protein